MATCERSAPTDEQPKLREVILMLSDKVGLQLVVAEGCTCRELQIALAELFGSRGQGWHLTEVGGGALDMRVEVPDKVELARGIADAKASRGSKITSSRVSASQRKPTPDSASHSPGPAASAPMADSSSGPRRPPVAAARSRTEPPVTSSPRRSSSALNADIAPAGIEEARRALRALASRGDLRMPKQTPAVRVLMEAVLMAMGNLRPTWEAAQRELQDMQFIVRVSAVSRPEPKGVRRLADKLETLSAPQQQEEIRRQGPAAAALLQWLMVLMQQPQAKPSAQGRQAFAGRSTVSNSDLSSAVDQGEFKADLAEGQQQTPPVRSPVVRDRQQRAQRPKSVPSAPAPPALVTVGQSPALDVAKQAVEALTNGELRDLRSQSQQTTTVLAAVGIVLDGIDPAREREDWSKRQLCQTMDFKKRLCDATENADALMKQLKQRPALVKLLKGPDMSADSVAKAPAAVRALAQWVRAMWGHGQQVRVRPLSAPTGAPGPGAPAPEEDGHPSEQPSAAAAPGEATGSEAAADPEPAPVAAPEVPSAGTNGTAAAAEVPAEENGPSGEEPSAPPDGGAAAESDAAADEAAADEQAVAAERPVSDGEGQ